MGDPTPEIVVGFSQTERVIPSTEAGREDLEASDLELSPPEEAQFLASLGRALFLLEEEERDASPGVLTAPQNAFASLLQSHLAELAAETGKYEELPAGGAEAKFDHGDILGWAKVVWVMLKASKQPILRPDPVAEPIPNELRMAVLGDWGTGLYGALPIASTIEADSQPYDLLLHLGDVYYAGTRREVRDRFLSRWPRRPEARSIALNSNHEMYSGGEAYFGLTLPAFGQTSSYLALQNDDWLLVGLDTGYQDHDIDGEQLAWLHRVIEDAGPDRRVILFSHHQLFSSLASQGPKLDAKLGDLLAAERIFAWYWGHEHLCMLYDQHPDTGLLARCAGHGSMPYSRRRLEKLPPRDRFSDHAIWRIADATAEAPGGLLLDGENQHIPGEEEKFGPHGYMTLHFDGPHIVERVHEPDGNVIWHQQLV